MEDVMDGASTARRGLSESDMARFNAIRERAAKLGVLDINFSSINSFDSLESYERTLDVIEENREILDQNAGEA
jgi:hypothetical protein